jgi:hypothetical protein
MVQRFLSWYIGQGDLRSLNMVQKVLRWYIGQGELRSLKYGAKHPHVPPEDALHHILNFLAHIAQCIT